MADSGTGSGSYMVNQLISEGRKYGVGVILATHTASDLSKQIVANSSTFISFYPREPGDVNYIANILSGGMPEKALAVKNRLHQLRVNEAILLSGRFKEPIVLRTRSAITEHERITAAPEPVKSHATTEKMLSFTKKPIRFEKFIEEFGPTDEAAIPSTGIGRITIDWNGIKEQWLMAARNGIPSVEHEVWVLKIAEELDRRGISNTIINNCTGPDIAAYVNGKKIALEYETGKKGATEAAFMISRRLGQYDRAVVLVNDLHFDAYKRGITGSRVSVFPISGIGRAVASITPTPSP